MDTWFERVVKDVIWKALIDWIGEVQVSQQAKLEKKLKELKLGENLSASPLVAVVAKGQDDVTLQDYVTLLIRGRFQLFDGAAAPFLRIQVRIATTVDLSLEDVPITILKWETVVGDLQIAKAGVFRAELAFGWDKGSWLGRGVIKVLPAGFGLDLLLGGLDERGLVIGIDTDLPAPIPLGATGLVLTGVGGTFAYNFVARLRHGVPMEVGGPATAIDYVAWALNKEDVDAWKAGPNDQTAVGIKLHARLGDQASMGRLLQLEAGLTVLTPGPVFVLGGAGHLVGSEKIGVTGYAGVDVASSSINLGMTIDAFAPAEGVRLLEASGSVDAFYSFKDTSLWFVHFGTKQAPAKVKVLFGMGADAFLLMGQDAVPGATSADGILFGLGISYGSTWKWWKISFTAEAAVSVSAGLGWNPFELYGDLLITGALGMKIWKFAFMISVRAEIKGYLPHPTRLEATASYALDLPWPIPTIRGTTTIALTKEQPGAPALVAPLLAGLPT